MTYIYRRPFAKALCKLLIHSIIWSLTHKVYLFSLFILIQIWNKKGSMSTYGRPPRDRQFPGSTRDKSSQPVCLSSHLKKWIELWKKQDGRSAIVAIISVVGELTTTHLKKKKPARTSNDHWGTKWSHSSRLHYYCHYQPDADITLLFFSSLYNQSLGH